MGEVKLTVQILKLIFWRWKVTNNLRRDETYYKHHQSAIIKILVVSVRAVWLCHCILAIPSRAQSRVKLNFSHFPLKLHSLFQFIFLFLRWRTHISKWRAAIFAARNSSPNVNNQDFIFLGSLRSFILDYDIRQNEKSEQKQNTHISKWSSTFLSPALVGFF